MFPPLPLILLTVTFVFIISFIPLFIIIYFHFSAFAFYPNLLHLNFFAPNCRRRSQFNPDQHYHHLLMIARVIIFIIIIVGVPPSTTITTKNLTACALTSPIHSTLTYDILDTHSYQ